MEPKLDKGALQSSGEERAFSQANTTATRAQEITLGTQGLKLFNAIISASGATCRDLMSFHFGDDAVDKLNLLSI